MGKAARNKNQAVASSSNKVHDETGVKVNIGTLTNAVTTLLGAVENMSLQLDELSSTVKGIVSNGKNVDSGCGKSTAVEPVISVNSDRDIVGEFHNLKQATNVAEYQKKFQELSDMVKMDYGLSECYLISCFLNGLKSEIKISIGNCKPETLFHAFNLARIEEIENEVVKDKLMSLIGNENMLSKYPQVYFGPDHPQKFGASVGEKAIKVLISSGSVYSYLDTSLAIAAGCEIEEAEPILVDFLMLGYKAVSRFRCPRFRWTVNGHDFVSDLRIVELNAAYNIVLGTDWLRENSPLCFSSDGITVEKGGKKIVLLDACGSAET